MRYAGRAARRGERGAVLIVSLIMLAVMTLLVISMLKSAVIELKIGGISQIAAMNLANAEMGINNFIANNNGRFAPNFLALAQAAGGPIMTVPDVDGGTVSVQAVQTRCGPPASSFGMGMASAGSSGVSIFVISFDLSATAIGNLGGSTIVHQGVESGTLAC